MTEPTNSGRPESRGSNSSRGRSIGEGQRFPIVISSSAFAQTGSESTNPSSSGSNTRGNQREVQERRDSSRASQRSLGKIPGEHEDPDETPKVSQGEFKVPVVPTTKRPSPPSASSASSAKKEKERALKGWQLDVANLRDFHIANGFTDVFRGVHNFFPEHWSVGRTKLIYGVGEPRDEFLRDIIPDIRGFNAKGEEQERVVVDDGKEATVRVIARFLPSVDIIQGILSYTAGRKISKDGVLKMAQESPDALEKLKASGKLFKEHVNRLVDLVALRRSPQFSGVAARYKAELKALIDEQMRAVIALRAATRRVNAKLAERDSELSGLDPGYKVKRRDAGTALAQFGITFGDVEEGGGGDVDLDDLTEDRLLSQLDF